MGLLEKITKLFKKEKLKARNFVEILKTDDESLMLTTKNKLEKYKIPVYLVNQVKDMKERKMSYTLRIPEQFLEQAKNLLNG